MKELEANKRQEGVKADQSAVGTVNRPLRLVCAVY